MLAASSRLARQAARVRAHVPSAVRALPRRSMNSPSDSKVPQAPQQQPPPPPPPPPPQPKPPQASAPLSPLPHSRVSTGKVESERAKQGAKPRARISMTTAIIGITFGSVVALYLEGMLPPPPDFFSRLLKGKMGAPKEDKRQAADPFKQASGGGEKKEGAADSEKPATTAAKTSDANKEAAPVAKSDGEQSAKEGGELTAKFGTGTGTEVTAVVKKEGEQGQQQEPRQPQPLAAKDAAAPTTAPLAFQPPAVGNQMGGSSASEHKDEAQAESEKEEDEEEEDDDDEDDEADDDVEGDDKVAHKAGEPRGLQQLVAVYPQREELLNHVLEMSLDANKKIDERVGAMRNEALAVLDSAMQRALQEEFKVAPLQPPTPRPAALKEDSVPSEVLAYLATVERERASYHALLSKGAAVVDSEFVARALQHVVAGAYDMHAAALKGLALETLAVQGTLQEARLFEVMTAEAKRQLATERAELEAEAKHAAEESTRSESEARISRLAELAARVEQLETETVRQFKRYREHTEKLHALTRALGAIREAAATGAPLLEPWTDARAAVGDSELVGRALRLVTPDALAAGVPTPAKLRAMYDDVEKQLRKSIVLHFGTERRRRRFGYSPETYGVLHVPTGAVVTVEPTFLNHAAAWVTSRLLFRDRSLRDGEGSWPRLARVGFFVDHGDLEAALREIKQFPPPVRETAQTWVQLVRQRQALDQAVRVMGAELALLKDVYR